MQDTEGRSRSVLLRALDNAAYVNLKLALRVKIDEKKCSSSYILFRLKIGLNDLV